MDTIGKYQKVPFSKIRELVIDVVEQGLLKHHVKVLLELDVTLAREYLRVYKEKQGVSLSFTGWMAKCIAQAVSENPQVHALRHGHTSMILFKDVDILITVQKTINGEEIPLPFVVRKANEKSVEQINSEIRSAQSQSVAKGAIMLGSNPWFARSYLWIPKFLRSALGRLITHDPFYIKKKTGTVGISAVGMMGNFNGWVIPISPQPLYFSLGGIVRKPGVIDEKILIREYLYLSFVFDHDVVDGAPITHFATCLTSLVESGYGLFTST
ncbi:2-oxo acid dehydrogenase subunit E2 [Chloroflexota bacterium]|nr:2-oxo acid dehydrogenase subunit E2 [Chloroflexota bacterium]